MGTKVVLQASRDFLYSFTVRASQIDINFLPVTLELKSRLEQLANASPEIYSLPVHLAAW